MASKRRIWNGVLVVLAAANLASIWFATRAGEPWHAAIHGALALGFGLWAQRRIRLEGARLGADALESGTAADIAELRDGIVEVRRDLNELQERLDFTERLLAQARDMERLPDRREP